MLIAAKLALVRMYKTQHKVNSLHSSSRFITKVFFYSNFLHLRNKDQCTKEAFYFPIVIPWKILM